jgi:hypothetical protein
LVAERAEVRCRTRFGEGDTRNQIRFPMEPIGICPLQDQGLSQSRATATWLTGSWVEG